MIPIWELEKKVMPIWETVIPIQEHIIRSMIPEWDTNSLLCFLVYQSLTDLTVMLFSEYLFSVSHINLRDAPHSTTFFHFNGQSVF